MLRVNGYENKFFLDRLRVELKKITFGERKYSKIAFEGIFAGKNKFKFPYVINKRDTGEIHMYVEIELSLLSEEYFNELIDWVRNIELREKFDIVDSSSKSIEYVYVIRCNYKKDMLKNKIEEKVRYDKEVDGAIKAMDATNKSARNY